jgi:hypothetical protein
MDKLLLSTFFALLAGCIAAIMSFVKLVNDKESRVTDHRQEWTQSVRQVLADLVAHASTLSMLAELSFDNAERLNDYNQRIAGGIADAGAKEAIQNLMEHHKKGMRALNQKVCSLINQCAKPTILHDYILSRAILILLILRTNLI